jgi:gluconolactonase
MPDLKEITTGLRFPEGPVCLSDGSVLVVEIAAGRLTKVAPGGAKTVVADTGGGPNGAAIGPDGACYLCNNGGFEWHEVGGLTFPGVQASDYTGGSLQRVDLATGAVETVYTHCGEVQLRGPNDLVFDAEGGVWFTDLGKTRERDQDRTGVFYARPDGSFITEAIFPVDMPNGIGLSPEGDRLYVAETPTARVFWFEIEGPGRIKTTPFSPNGGHLLVTLPGLKLLDSLAVDAEGNVCVATLMEGGITTISPDGGRVEFLPTGDPMTTNIAFGGDGLRTAYLTLSGSGRLVSAAWPTPGLRLHFNG